MTDSVVDDLVASIPTVASGDLPDGDALRTALVGGLVGFIPDDASVVSGVMQVNLDDVTMGAVMPAFVYGDGVFKFDELDETTVHDGITCLVLLSGRRYKLLGEIRVKALKSRSVTLPPKAADVDPAARPVFGDAYLVLGGTWTAAINSIAIWTSRGWAEILPGFGPPLLVEDEQCYVWWSGAGGWKDGPWNKSFGAKTVPFSALVWHGQVVNQTQYAPPGSRKTGATPACPLGGTAANINDNSDTTVALTSALGNLTGASIASRIVGRLTLAAAATLICIEARGVLGSAVSSSNAMGLYYSTDSGATWTQAGAGFTLSTAAQFIQRTGSFAGVTDIALVTEGKNWAADTNTLAGLNAFDATVTGAVGDAYVIGASPFGIFAGAAGKIAICEIVNSYTIVTPEDGDTIYDKAQMMPFRWSASGSAWTTAGGLMKCVVTPFIAPGSFVFSKNARCVFVRAYPIGGGGGSGPVTINSTSSSFGSHCSATGGGNNAIAPGIGIGGDVNLNGGFGINDVATSPGGRGAGPYASPFGNGANGGVSMNGGSGGGGAVKMLLAAELLANEPITVGAGGQGGGSLPGNDGAVFVEEWIAI